MKQRITTNSSAASKNGTGSTRREFLLAAAGLTLTGALTALPGRAFAASVTSGRDALRDFISVSHSITEHQHLDVELGARFFTAFTESDAHFAERVGQLARLSQPGDSAEQLMDRARAAGLGDFLYAIVTAWYTGTIGNDYQGKLIAYKQALMYQPVSDGLIVPTYCGNGPLWWTQPLPDDNNSLISSL